MGNEPVIDFAEALGRAMGDLDFLKMMLEELQKSIPEMMDRLAKDQQDCDMNALDRDAHQFKGAAANLGAKGIAAAALKLEQIGKSGDPQGCEEAYENLRQAVEVFDCHLSQIDWQTVATGR
jgi:two-component system, sensor histidine kinase and response regulator